jgi:outer membrane protein TolC
LRALVTRREAAQVRTRGARRAFAPTLGVQAEGGVQAIDLGQWRSQGFWTAGAVLSVPLSTGGSTYARLQQAEATQRRTAAELASATLVAKRRIADARLRERQLAAALELYQQQAVAARAAFDESRLGYAAGLSQYLVVLAALNTAQAAELNLVSARRDLLIARVDLYEALGFRSSSPR